MLTGYEVPIVETVDEITSLVRDDNKLSRIAIKYENVINACGFGRFQRILLFVCGWAFISDSAEVQVVSFVLPAACDLEMTSSQKGCLNAIIFVGMMIGGYAFGGAADIKGRRLVLLWSMTINGLFGFISAFSPTFIWFMFFRFLSGIGVGAALPIVFSYFAEFLSKDQRGPMIALLASFLMVGNIMTSGLAWLIIPSDIFTGYVGGVFVGSWRVFVAVLSLPALSAAIMFYFLPESPKFLLKIGRIEEAKQIFEDIYYINCKDKERPIPLIISQCSFFECEDDDNNCTKSTGLNSISDNIILKVIKSTGTLFKKPLKSASITLTVIWFTLSFGYYGLWMWFPEIFKRIQDGSSSCGNINVSSQQPIYNNITNINNSTTKMLKLECISDEHQYNLYLQSFLVAFSNLPGNIVTVATINKIGRINLLGVSLLLSAISVFYFRLVTNQVEMMIMACAFSGLSIVSWNVLNAVALENYPTQLRSTAFGLQTSVGRIASILANIVFGVLVDVRCAIPLVLVSGFLAIGGITVFNLPRTDDKILA